MRSLDEVVAAADPCEWLLKQSLNFALKNIVCDRKQIAVVRLNTKASFTSRENVEVVEPA
jgi:hypothetical protein